MLSKITGRDRLRNHGGPGRILKVLDELRTDFGIAYAALDTDARSQSLRRCVMHAGFSYLNAASDCLNCEVRHLPNLRTYIDELADTAEAVGLSISVVPCSFDEESVYALHLYTIVGNPSLIDLTHPRKTKKALRKIVAVRDRLAHPRRSSELEITLGDLRRCADVIGWVHARLHRLLASSSHDPIGQWIDEVNNRAVLRSPLIESREASDTSRPFANGATRPSILGPLMRPPSE